MNLELLKQAIIAKLIKYPTIYAVEEYIPEIERTETLDQLLEIVHISRVEVKTLYRGKVKLVIYF